VTSSSSPSPSPLTANGGVDPDVLRQLLCSAREQITQGKANEALSLVLTAVRAVHGEAGVWQVINQTRLQHGMAPHSDQLVSQFLPADQGNNMNFHETKTDFSTSSANSSSTSRSGKDEMISEVDRLAHEIASLSMNYHRGPPAPMSVSSLSGSSHSQPSATAANSIPRSVLTANSHYNHSATSSSSSSSSSSMDLEYDSKLSSFQEDDGDDDPHEAILVNSGQGELLASALASDSTTICPLCNAVIPSARFEVHVNYWCDAIKD
jgi:hypothetical protein